MNTAVFLKKKKRVIAPTNVVVPVSSVELNQSTALGYVDDTIQLIATVLPPQASNKVVVWSSSNESIATVSTTGLVTLITDGEVTITVTTDDGSFTDTCVITITVEPVAFAASYLFTSEGMNETQLLDQSGQAHHITLVDGLKPEFLYGFALQNDVKYPADENGFYADLDYEAFYLVREPFHVDAEQFLLAPADDAAFIAIDTDNRFYDEDGIPRPFALQDIADLPSTYFTAVITDNILISLTIE